MGSDELIKILMVDDEEVLRESVADFLEDRDFQVITAENGYQALELFEKEQPSTINNIFLNIGF